MKYHIQFFLIASLFLSGCTSKDGDINLFSIDEDIAMGRQFDEQILSDPASYPVLQRRDYPELYARLDTMVNRILASPAVLHREEFDWQLRVLYDDSVLNAFCTPGGFIYVYTGLIRFLDSEDQLAGVIGHEIAHADMRHSSEQLSKQYGLRLIIELVVGESSMLGSLAGNLLELAFSRSDESEADRMSVRYLYPTGYDARGAGHFFEKMKAKGEDLGPLVFMSTHPDPGNRLEQIRQEWELLGGEEGSRDSLAYKQLKSLLPS
jgi:predicted Zn-dependent protease